MPLLGLVWRRWHLRGMEVEMELIKAQIEHIFGAVEARGAEPKRVIEDESMFAADYPPPPQPGASGSSVATWHAWKYTANDFLRENLAYCLCSPMRLHHPAVGKDILREDATSVVRTDHD
jgi:hypothetical protein